MNLVAHTNSTMVISNSEASEAVLRQYDATKHQKATAEDYKFFYAELPEALYLTDLGNSRYKLIPMYLDVSVEREENGVVVISHEKSFAHGSGRSIAEAVSDFQQILIERFEYLSANADALSRVLQEQLSYLESIIKRIP